ncbi:MULTISPECIES: universal stress protein [Clostridium]|jgi:Universal stress protein UspA and related nucleotide-binding proteins|uniref:Nucleotide-binding universal stress UspA family protein n=4 Tax=Clostridium TaxID=1485 RepID=A0A0B5QGX1_CLOBE|nr:MULTISPECIES: universal stress protein [Clostridium]ABR32980.1 UspA domain protein [Clostridium beijerinckii NCIMB 8052]AIU04006.1 UspA domain-containing protein [Clostridium beijerinckii ATCC 35702]AJG97501.1 universal stress protein [Clostridium beijerinckii]ALB47885.1 universal stress protein [Clostridium beijerinckii NRRL B-598]AQS03407.1 universal stress protein family protein [Clostridium beijerinckii]
MNKRKVLIPIDGTERSMHSLEFVKEIFPDKDSIEIIIMNVKELVLINEMIVADEIKFAQELGEEILQAAKEKMKDYKTETYFTFGYPGDEIIKKANEENIGVIVMTKSTKRGLNRMIGSVTTNVVKRAKCIVMIVPNDFSISIK